MRTSFLTAATVVVSVFLTACSGLKMNERVAASNELQQAATYSWKSEVVHDTSSTGGDSAHFDSNVRNAVASVLSLKGYKYVSENADFIMDYRITVVPGEATAEQYRNTHIPYQSGAAMGRIEFNDWNNIQATNEFYERGYLALTAFAPSKPVIWWETIASKMIDDGDSAEHRSRTLRQAIGKMLKAFPAAGHKQ
tara:strand:- start:2945 stop:3529 length:585 start_codon:yes stop_codon:yes gene_type:complete